MKIWTATRRARTCAVAFALTLGTLLTLAGVNAATAAAATAGDPPITQRSSTGVTADALPTVQIDGVVWDQAIVGNTVYAGGQFSNARPAGSAAGQNQTVRNNLLSYDITTGNLNTSFNPNLNGMVKVLALSPDKSRLYVGGSFTTAGGVPRDRIAAYDTATGALVSSFTPSLDASVQGITATNTTVYVGGVFSTANGVARSRLAAFDAATGNLLGWAPTADYDVNALLLTPDGSKVIVAGAFANINGSTAQGLGAVDANTGALDPWAANTVVKDYGQTAAMLSLHTDGSTIYGSGYWFGGTGNFEGVWAADPATGAIKWLADCHGDTYDEVPVNGVVYSVSHHHDCANIGSFPDQNPRTHWRADAFTADAETTVRHNLESGYHDFYGYPAPSQINWFPQLAAGTFTGQSQAAWTVEATSSYVVLGGEFPSVNGAAQQGLVRFAVPSIAPKQMGHQIYSADSAPVLKAVGANAVRVSWGTNWDEDDEYLNYAVLRSDKGSPVYTVNGVQSLWWARRYLTIVDTGLSPNTTYTYTIRENDPDGNYAWSSSVSVTTPATGSIPADNGYSTQVKTDGASDYWRLDDAPGATTSTDWAGPSDLTLGSGVALGASGAIANSTDTAARFDGTTNGLAVGSTPAIGPMIFSAEAWIKTTTTSGGKIIGFGDARSGNSSSYDRHIYMDGSGHLIFGVYPGAVKTISSSAAYNDGQWHQVVATLSGAGIVLYVDGAKVASDPTVQNALAYTGYWRLGGDNLGGWPNVGSSSYFAGTIDDAAVYPTALTAGQVQAHYAVATGTSNVSPVAVFTSSCTAATCAFDGSGSNDPDGSVASYAWDFGDGQAGTGVKPSHTYTTSGTYSVSLTVTDNRGATNSVTHSVTVTVPPTNQPPVASFTSSCNGRVCGFDGSGSSDPDGTVAAYAWNFGDSSTGTGAKPNHTFTADGTYSVTLTVTDNQGATNSVTKQVTVKANVPPTASFTASCTALTCSVNGSASSDPDGTIASYAWDFGDGATATGATTSHTYTAGGTYTIKLTVTDNQGATASKTQSVNVTAASNKPPVAAFAASSTNLTVAFDASGSSDPDGTVAAYAWTFGDGSTGTGKTVSHTYAGTGFYDVKLTVTDNGGATNSVIKRVVVGTSPLAADSFSRTASNSWGSADTGGSWTLSNSSRFSTDGSVGKLTLAAPAVGASATLNAVSTTNINVVSDLSVDKSATGGGLLATYSLRHTSSGEYRGKVLLQAGGVLSLEITRLSGSTETLIKQATISGLTYAPGDQLRVRFVATGTGTTSLTGKIWRSGAAEPSSAQVSGTDTTPALQTAGSFAFQGYLSGSSTNAPVTLRLDNLLITAS